MQPTEAFERIYGRPMRTLLRAMIDLVGIVTGCGDTPTARLAVFTLLAQVIALRASWAMLLKMIEQDTIDLTLLKAVRSKFLPAQT